MALIARSIKQDGTYAPRAVNILGQIPKQALFNTAQGLRHPASIYGGSLDQVADAFCQTAEEYLLQTQENRDLNSASLRMGPLLNYQRNFLRTLQEHFDALWMVLKTLIDPAPAPKVREFNDRYVVDNKLPGAKSFEDAIANYKNTLKIVNKLRHQHCPLRGLAVWSRVGVHLGYCLEEPDAKGALGPSPEIHPDQGAFSFARDLTWHLAQVYLCSEKLTKAVTTALESRRILAESKVTTADAK